METVSRYVTQNHSQSVAFKASSPRLPQSQSSECNGLTKIKKKTKKKKGKGKEKSRIKHIDKYGASHHHSCLFLSLESQASAVVVAVYTATVSVGQKLDARG